MAVELAYALPERQWVKTLVLPVGSTVQDALNAAQALEFLPNLDKPPLTVGIFATPCGLDRLLCPGDRVELYRTLVQDPKDARRQRAKKDQAGRVKA